MIGKKTPKEEFREAVETAKQELAKAISWLYSHPKIWTPEFVDEAKHVEREVREALDDLVYRAYEEAEEREI